MSNEFHLTQDHIDLLQHVNIRWMDAEYGAPQVDPKRPFGNSGRSYIEREICEYLGLEPIATDREGTDVYDDDEQREAVETYHELDTAMKIVLRCQTFTPGVFATSGKYKRDWKRQTAGDLGLETGDECPVCNERVLEPTSVVSVVITMAGDMKCRNCSAFYGKPDSV